MGESFFVQSSYLKSKHGRGRLCNFFAKKSICELQHLIRGMVRVHVHLPFSHASHLIRLPVGPILRPPQGPKQSRSVPHLSSRWSCRLLRPVRLGKSSDLYLGFQCFSADTIANFCFATCFNQLSFPDFRGDVVVGVDIAMDTLTLRKFSEVLILLVRHFPPCLLAHISPALNGLTTCREVSQQRHPFLRVHVV
jgi:hypothetical protein